MKLFVIDSFTNERFKGNPAGVCLATSPLPDELMLSIAKELNFSETAFVQSLPENKKYSIRYFSPKMEIPLCGHATLAASFVIFEIEGYNDITFVNVNNINLPIRKIGNLIEMEFPIYQMEIIEVSALMLKALTLDETIACFYNKETNIIIIEVNSADIVESIKPDFRMLQESHSSIGGVIVMSQGRGKYDFFYRHFWPWNGTDEDPVTGAVQSYLAPYWSHRLGKKILQAFQPSERTGFMEIEVLSEKVLIRGQAVSVFSGEIEY